MSVVALSPFITLFINGQGWRLKVPKIRKSEFAWMGCRSYSNFWTRGVAIAYL